MRLALKFFIIANSTELVEISDMRETISFVMENGGEYIFHSKPPN